MKLKEFMSDNSNIGKYFVLRHIPELQMNFKDTVFFVSCTLSQCPLVRFSICHFYGDGEVIRPATEEEIEQYQKEYVEYQKNEMDLYDA
jgi:hypothetical protein